jgi:two-component system cell cycle sensor histidine kinase/response regulator CckA
LPRCYGKRRRRKLAEERIHTIFEHSPDGIALLDMQGKIVECNPAFSATLGYSAAELGFLTFPDFMFPDDVVRARNLFDEIAAGKRESYQLETRYLVKDGHTIWGHLTVSAVKRLGASQYCVGMLKDITARKQLEQQLSQAQKMEAVGRLAGGIAHDFNNVLGIISGYTDLALKDKGLGEPSRHRLTEIKTAAARALMITRQLLTFSRKDVLQVQVLHLNSAVIETAGMLERLLGEDIELVTSLDPDLGSVVIDPAGLHQIVMNLAVNARDAMPNGGKLTIETSSVVLDETYARMHSGVQPGEYVMLVVSDTGVGIRPEIQKHIFEPFFTTKDVGRGTGLGLATVFGIVQQSGGHLSVASEVGVGTVFRIYFPRAVAAAAITQARDEEFSPCGNETILLVEDDNALRKLNATLLEDLGYTVMQADSGPEAVKLVSRYRGPLDILITDVIMPGMNGKQLSDRLTELRRDLKVLFVSGYTDTVVGSELLADGSQFLQKPFSAPILAKKVREVLDARQTTA